MKVFDPKKVAEFLALYDVHVIDVMEIETEVDGCVSLVNNSNERVYIQVCDSGGLILSRYDKKEGSCEYGKLRSTKEEILKDVRACSSVG